MSESQPSRQSDTRRLEVRFSERENKMILRMKRCFEKYLKDLDALNKQFPDQNLSIVCTDFSELRTILSNWHLARREHDKKTELDAYYKAECQAWNIMIYVRKWFKDQESTHHSQVGSSGDYITAMKDFQADFRMALESLMSDQKPIDYIADIVDVTQSASFWLKKISELEIDNRLVGKFRDLTSDLTALFHIEDHDKEGWQEHCDGIKTKLLRLALEVDDSIKAQMDLLEEHRDNPDSAVSITEAEARALDVPHEILCTCSRHGSRLSSQYYAAEVSARTLESLFSKLMALLDLLIGTKIKGSNGNATIVSINERSVFLFQYLRDQFRESMTGIASPKKLSQQFMADFQRGLQGHVMSSKAAARIEQALDMSAAEPSLMDAAASIIDHSFHRYSDIINFSMQESIDIVFAICIKCGWLLENHREKWSTYVKTNVKNVETSPNTEFLGWLLRQLGAGRARILERVLRERYEWRAVIGPYDLQKLVGKGGQGEVWYGINSRTREVRAIKVLLNATDAGRKIFIREALTTHGMKGAHVVPSYGHASIHDTPVMFQEFVPRSRNLTDLFLERGQSLPLNSVVRIIAAVAAGCSSGHYLDSPVFHRDLKLPNILIARDGTPKVCDWGLAGHLNPQAPIWFAGTPNYMAPELGKVGIELLDGKADVYALGVIAYMLLAAAPPVKVPSQLPDFKHLPSLSEIIAARRKFIQDICDKHRNKEVDYERVRNAYMEMPEQLITLVSSMLDADPNQRPDMLDVILRLREIFPDDFPEVALPPEGIDRDNLASIRQFIDSLDIKAFEEDMAPERIQIPPQHIEGSCEPTITIGDAFYQESQTSAVDVPFFLRAQLQDVLKRFDPEAPDPHEASDDYGID